VRSACAIPIRRSSSHGSLPTGRRDVAEIARLVWLETGRRDDAAVSEFFRLMARMGLVGLDP
jgi:hypothetical protein